MNLLGNLGGEFHSPPSDLDFAGQRRDKAKDEKEVKKRSSKACISVFCHIIMLGILNLYHI